MDRLLKRSLWVELLFGLAVIVFGVILGGPVLPAMGACMVALAAQCSAGTKKFQGGAVALGIVALAALVGSGLASFFHLTSLSRYSDDTSPLTVLFVLAVVVLGQSFLSLSVEDRPELTGLRRGIRLLTVFAVIGFIGVVLTYVLSYVLFDSALSSYAEGNAVQDFHYLEGVLSLAMSLTSARGVLRAFFGKDRMIESQEETNVQEA